MLQASTTPAGHRAGQLVSLLCSLSGGTCLWCIVYSLANCVLLIVPSVSKCMPLIRSWVCGAESCRSADALCMVCYSLDVIKIDHPTVRSSRLSAMSALLSLPNPLLSMSCMNW